MHAAGCVAGLALFLLVLWDGFETVLLPRRVTRKFRLARWFYRVAWHVWSGVFGRMTHRKRREQALSAFGPFSMLLLLALWAGGLILAFALIHWGRQSPLVSQHERLLGFGGYFYMSGTTFLTLGLGDIVPVDPLARALAIVEAGTGFGFLAIVIGYLPVLYAAFSERERSVALLDARAGTPSSATELYRRYAQARSLPALDALFADWERWAANLLESHISYPVLSFYRSQHDNQSWLGSLTTILDACALTLAGVEGVSPWQAQLTFAMARHAVVDLAQIYGTAPRAPTPSRLPPEEAARMLRKLRRAGVVLREEGLVDRLAELRPQYEPYVTTLADYLLLPVPAWTRHGDPPDNWQTSAWERRAQRVVGGNAADPDDDHGG